MMSHLKEAFQFDIQIRQDDDKLPAALTLWRKTSSKASCMKMPGSK